MLAMALKFNLKNPKLRRKTFIFLIGTAISLIAFYEVYPLVSEVFPKNESFKIAVLLFGAIVICGVSYGVMKTVRVFLEKIKFHHQFSSIVFGIFLVLEILLASSGKLALFKIPGEQLTKIIITAIVIAFIEEFIFRGVIFNALIALFFKSKNILFLAGVCSAIIFGIGHGFNLFVQPASTTAIQIIMAADLGILYAYIHMVTNNLSWCIVLHAWHDMSLQLVQPTAPNTIWLFVGIYLIIFLIMCWAMFSYNKKLNMYLRKLDKSLT
ncbi:CPBP family intramembrane metalloprotease [Lactobacillus sp. PV037]|uniref:CPBP family intramembrane glutamic endopeptidase n=1 Tax=unclassified Lactobacillus TaxID=2620435 RepID=UPI00223FEC40|nr:MULTISPECIES: CPBP family intramembrane glutamic endopeptidase [unclassified Lactobacillus]QNQ82695.1 CPBP family intramembrane metalloprotease [Lactobacillus sp. PV012]QNQ83186.1 CPBP family intramembrane metalloprotease [Lactobacillus sp. PV037]